MNVIGGYFELEFRKGEEYYPDAIKLNSGRNAFEYILRSKGYRKVYLPYYTCDVMLDSVRKLGIEYELYGIDKNFEPKIEITELKTDEVFVYTNYFGICDMQVKRLANKYKYLIIDNSQAFFSRPINGVDTFYSPRKFFGVPDGAYLFTNKELETDFEQDISLYRFEHLLGRIDVGAEKYYESFKKNDGSLVGQPIKRMSNLTTLLLQGIQYNNHAKTRSENFQYLHDSLKESNQLMIKSTSYGAPMVYPYLTQQGKMLKELLLSHNIFVATYWPNLKHQAPQNEVYLKTNLIAIPIDQRYGINEMKIILKILLQNV